MTRTSRRLTSTLALFLTCFGATPLLAAPLEPRDAQCRVKVGEAARDYALFLTKRIGLCHRMRLKGNLPPAIDCADPSTWAANGFQRGVDLQNKAINRLPDRVATCNPTGGLAALGYGTCPAPCDAISINSIGTLTECVQCKVEDDILGAAATIFGTPSLAMTRAEQKCQERAGRYLTQYVKDRLYLQNICQHGVELVRDGFEMANCIAINTNTHPFYVRLQIVKAQQDKVLQNRCEDIDVDTALAGCGTDAASLAACVAAEIESATDSLWQTAFPPVP